ncbi:MAG: RecQ family ATP-dependent DNA helicase [Bacteroidales bacterium]|nr:RecQ family ATP-dependent DNA helicase [Bacteroidales bacterium]
MTKQETLQRYWGYDSFRPQQEAIIDHVLSGADAIALLPTGGGKSLCYQLPALLMEGTCLVVSPLIALMKDQVEQLRRRGIKECACITSGASPAEAEVVLNNCIYGTVKLLYVSPERLRNRQFVAYLRKMKLSFVAVDEAHCISQWGYDFRPSYLQVADVRLYHPQVPILALTATATPEVVADIAARLGLRGGTVFRSSFERPNLAYMVITDPDKHGRLLRILESVKGAAVVYVRSRRRTQEVADELTRHGIRATYYHAGLSAHERDIRQHEWMRSPDGVMVATTAFGMGIDRPDVRVVLHLDVPTTVEAYFQEAGRAGRDGKPAYAVLLANNSDTAKLDATIESAYPPLNYVRNVYKAVCNYYSVPIGSGADSSYDFDLQTLCNTYGFDVTTCYSALHLLEAEGLIAIPDRNDPSSKLHLLMGRDEAYRYQVDHVREGNLLQVLMRMYGGIATDFVDINEREVARRCYTTPDIVAALLKQMAQNGVVAYKPVPKGLQIHFTANRIDASALSLTESNYKQLKETAQRRVAAMQSYIGECDECRSRWLLAYFGEKQAQPCGRCDVCLSRQSHADESTEQAIREQLSRCPRSAKALQQMLPALQPQSVEQALRVMIDRGEVTVDSNLLMHLKS